MATISETELKQKISELMMLVKEFSVNYRKDLVLKDKREEFKLTIFDKDVVLEFSL